MEFGTIKTLLYISNWVAFEKKGIIQILNTKTNQISQINLPELIAGPADFTIYKNQLIIPEMMAGTIRFINLK